VAKLLVSVRTAIEAQAALAGGAAIIDVKEPLRGPLGRADVEVWHQVRSAVDTRIPVSVALGELNEWFLPAAAVRTASDGAGISYFKLGLANSEPAWRARFRTVRDQIFAIGSPSPTWVAVVYADWQGARAPAPRDVIDEALEIDECSGVLVDSWDKSAPSPLDAGWKPLSDRVKSSGRFLALAESTLTRSNDSLRWSQTSSPCAAPRARAVIGWAP